MIEETTNKVFLIDFGISKDCTKKTKKKGATYYLAPETFDDEEDDEGNIISKITHKVDVWSYGCILSYLFSGFLPWTPKYKDSEPIIQKCLIKKSPFPVPDVIKNETIKKIIEMATIIDPDKRANINEIKEVLDKL